MDKNQSKLSIIIDYSATVSILEFYLFIYLYLFFDPFFVVGLSH